MSDAISAPEGEGEEGRPARNKRPRPIELKVVADLPREPEERRAIAARICSAVAVGHNVTDACAMPGMPGLATFWSWRNDDPAIREMYDRARVSHYELRADLILHLAEEEPPTLEDSKRNQKYDSAYVSHRNNLIDHIKWMLSKVLPRAYGSRVDIETKVELKAPMSDAEIRHIVATTSRLIEDLPMPGRDAKSEP